MTWRVSQSMLIWWMLATTAHLPFPVFDGDTLGSAQWRVSGQFGLGDLDREPLADEGLDFVVVLFGWDAPDDPDHDPERGDCCFGLGPTFVRTRTLRPRLYSRSPTFAAQVSGGEPTFRLINSGLQQRSPSHLLPLSRDDDSNRLIVMRC